MKDEVALGEAVGQRVRELREQLGITQDELARCCHHVGVTDWKPARIAQIERGSATPTLPLLIGLALGFSVADPEITVADLMPEDGLLRVGDNLTVPYAALRQHLRCPPVLSLSRIQTPQAPEHERGWGAADDLAVEELNMPAFVIRQAAERLWGTSETVTTERDRRAGEGATPQRRGAVTRALLRELAAEIVRGEDADIR